MKVLRVAQTLYPEVTGGGAYHVHAMSRDQAAMGHDVTVLTVAEPESERPRTERRDGYRVVRCEPTAELLGNRLSLDLARRLRDLDDVDVVHAHSHLYASTNLAALRRRLGDVPLAVTNHGLYSQTAPEWAFEAYLRTLGRWTFDAADLVFCYTESERARLRTLGVESPVAVVQNGIDTDRFRPDGPESDRLDASGPALLFVGRLVDGKRPGLALDAVGVLREEFPDVTLYVCGDGPLREQLSASAQRELPDHVEFLDHVPYDEMPEVYRSADLLVLPSRAEGVPRTVLEAAASGTPVVTAELDHLEDVVAGNGTTAPVEDAQRFAAEVASLLRSDDATGATDESSTSDAPGPTDGSSATDPADATDGSSASDPARATDGLGTTDGSGTTAAAAGDGYAWRETVERTTRELERLVERESYGRGNQPSVGPGGQ